MEAAKKQPVLPGLKSGSEQFFSSYFIVTAINTLI
jgi:hypothetical protein